MSEIGSWYIARVCPDEELVGVVRKEGVLKWIHAV